MTQRERLLNALRFQPVDHPPLAMPGPWPETRRRWEREGLPVGADLYEFFGLEPLEARPVGIDTLLYPPFAERILDEDDEFVVKIDRHGVKVRCFKDHESMPEHLEYPITGPESLAWLRGKLDPDTPGRVAADWRRAAQAVRARGGLVFCNGGMYFAFLNEHMGTAPLALAYYDTPGFVHEVNDRLCRLCERAIARCQAEFRLDYLAYHEDMACKTGSIIAPALFREFMTPYYRRIQRLAVAHGLDLGWMDSDGDIRELIPLWLEVGVNVFSPLEVAAGMDVVRLRAEYGRRIGMIGGFDKRILAAGPAAVRAELERIRPVIEGGGYIPNCDHGVPPDVPFASVRCFVETLKSLYGIA